MKRKQKRFLQMTLLFTAALIFLPDIGLWSLYKEKHLVKPPEAAEPQASKRRTTVLPLPSQWDGGENAKGKSEKTRGLSPLKKNVDKLKNNVYGEVNNPRFTYATITFDMVEMFNMGMLNMLNYHEEHLQSEILVLFNMSETAWRDCVF
ncbi:hypothetical protein DUI87_08896 [Hirundo rustica rustica]|uniref:Uncharacterized protein n=1 Tax=Hirundo rustica rustica TaxID=333673 RepID=A0A3M0KL37_HIRRU|nr:hypothetical protein DUI87_08896 [Hirundo rustica rustica]